MALHLPFLEPLLGGQTNPTGGRAMSMQRLPTQSPDRVGQVNGSASVALPATRPASPMSTSRGQTHQPHFQRYPEPGLEATFLTLSGRTYGLTLEEELPLNFIRYDHPAGSQKRIESGWGRSQPALPGCARGNQRAARCRRHAEIVQGAGRQNFADLQHAAGGQLNPPSSCPPTTREITQTITSSLRKSCPLSPIIRRCVGRSRVRS